MYWGCKNPTYPDITSYQHVPGLVCASVLSVELDGFEEGLHFTRLLLQEVWRRRRWEKTNKTQECWWLWMNRLHNVSSVCVHCQRCDTTFIIWIKRKASSTRSAARSRDSSGSVVMATLSKVLQVIRHKPKPSNPVRIKHSLTVHSVTERRQQLQSSEEWLDHYWLSITYNQYHTVGKTILFNIRATTTNNFH